MRDYEKLIFDLREMAEWIGPDNYELPITIYDRIVEAADAVEELLNHEWIKIESRPMTEEERKEWSENFVFDIEDEYAIIYTSKLPDDGQEVLVCNKWGRVWIDTFSDDPDYGVGFEENGDMDGIVAWMPKPKPYEPPKEASQ